MYLVVCCSLLLLPGELTSGPQPGKKFGPYTFLMATGPNRGTSHCYVCETGDDPAVIILARSTSEPLGELIKKLDKQLTSISADKLHVWVTFVGMKQTEKEALIVQWSKKLGIRTVPMGIVEAVSGPPSYQIHPDADVTILLAKSGKVVKNFAFASQALTQAEGKKILDQVPALLK